MTDLITKRAEKSAPITASEFDRNMDCLSLDLHNVKSYGAVGDGTSRQVNDATYGIIGPGKLYADLTAAQTGTGIADLALTDELDWCAHQSAINAAVFGGVVYTPPGVYVCNRTITLPEQSKWTEDDETQRKAVHWVGAGDRVSILSWPTDLGAGTYAVFCEGRDTSHQDNGQWAHIRDLQLRGPAFGAAKVLGTPNCNQHGIAIGPGRNLQRVRVRHFNHGISWKGGQMRMDEVESNSNFYSLYFDTPLTHDYGDILFTKCWFNGALMAAIAVKNDSTIGGSQFIGCYIGGAPYAFLGEAGGANRYLLDSVTMIGVQFEYVGNAIFWDDNWDSTDGAASTRHWSIRRLKIIDSYHHTDTGTSDSTVLTTDGRGRHYVGFLRNMEEFEFKGFREAGFAWQPGSLGYFDCLHATGTLEGDLDAILIDCDAAGVRLFSGLGNFPYNHIRLIARTWEGELYRHSTASSPTAIVANDLLMQGGDSASFVRKMNFGPTTGRVLGVARAGAASNEWLPVARRGIAKVKVGSAPASNGLFMIPDLTASVYGQATTTNSPYAAGVIGRNMNTSSPPDVMLDL